MPGPPGLRLEPRLDEQDAARLEVRRHGGDRRVQPLLGHRVADCGEEARDGVEATPEVEGGHVAVVERELGQPLARHGEQTVVEVEALRVREALPQLGEVLAGAARDVEQRARLRPPLLDQLHEPLRLGRVVLEGVDEVVELLGAVEHGANLAVSGQRPLEAGLVAADTPFVDAAHEIRRPLGQVLVDQGLITAEQLEQALAVQSDTEKQLGEVLVMLGFISPGVVANGLAEQHGGPLKTEYGISAGFGGERQEARPVRETEEPAAAQQEAQDVLAPWRTAVEQRDALIAQLRPELGKRGAQVEALSEQLATGAMRIAELEAQLEGRGSGDESLRAALAQREEQLAAALARVEQADAAMRAAAEERGPLEGRIRELEQERDRHLASVQQAAAEVRASAEGRGALERRIQELEQERGRHLAAVEELQATSAAQAQDLAARETESGNLADLEGLLENVTGVLHARVQELEAERGRLEAERDELQGRLAGAIAAAPAAEPPAPVVSATRAYDESAHLLFVPSAAGYLLLERTGPAPGAGETVEVEGSTLVVTKIGPSPFGSSSLACAYLAEA